MIQHHSSIVSFIFPIFIDHEGKKSSFSYDFLQMHEFYATFVRQIGDTMTF